MTNPHFSASNGITTYKYDALGRMLYQCNPDNGTGGGACVPGASYLESSYSANTTTTYDEERNVTLKATDALGRLTKVVEPGGLTTTYQYDALNNLKCVDQWGTSAIGAACSSSKNRSFSYDSLSRLIGSQNPETGPISYNFVTSGVLCAGDASLPCSETNANSVTTTYTYDSLNRLLSKSYPLSSSSSITMSSCYQYDTSTVANAIGRIINEWTQKNSCPVPAALPAQGLLTRGSIVAYDPMGRVTQSQQCVLSTCTAANPFKVVRGYDLAGNQVLWTDGVGQNQFNQSYDAAGRPATLTSWLTDSIHPKTLFSVYDNSTAPCGTSGYAPNGGLQNWMLGPNLNLSRCYDSRLRIVSQTVTHP